MGEAKTFLVTGATDGIGQETAEELARRGARVLVHGRTLEKAERVVAGIRAAGGAAEAVFADLGSLAAVRALAASIERFGALDVLVNNAGIFAKERSLSADGFELTFAVNHLAPFALTHLCLPSLRAAKQARIVNLSSIAHSRGALSWDDLGLERGFDGYRAYAASKLMNVLFTYELARRLGPLGIMANAVHPGVISTKLLRTGFGMGGASVADGAATSVRCATDAALDGVSGRYFADTRETASSRTSYDRDAQRRLYERSVELTGVTPLPA
jgi:retinol dehydrogenase-12